MKTPVAMKEHSWSPITYDVEQNMVGTKIEHAAFTNLLETSNDIHLYSESIQDPANTTKNSTSLSSQTNSTANTKKVVISKTHAYNATGNATTAKA